MWRSFFMATGFALCILGAECMVVDRFVLAESITTSTPDIDTDAYTSWSPDISSTSKSRVLIPPEWAPWGLLSGGVMLVLYTASYTPRRQSTLDDDDD